MQHIANPSPANPDTTEQLILKGSTPKKTSPLVKLVEGMEFSIRPSL